MRTPTSLSPRAAAWGRRSVVVIVAVALSAVSIYFTIRPQIDATDRAALKENFAFKTVTLNSAPPDGHNVRAVNPNFLSLDGWISAVGAAVALVDLRGLGRTADACLVDPRNDSVTVMPLPEGGGPQYPRFELTPIGLAYNATMAPMKCVPGDFDEDGTEDFLVSYWGRSPVIFLNQAESRTAAPQESMFVAHEVLDPPQLWNTTTANVGDIDGDGHADLLLGNFFPDGARVLDASATDDQRMQMQDSLNKALNGGGVKLLLSHPTGVPKAMPSFQDVTSSLPVDSTSGWNLATGMQDLTGDQRPELYIANDFGPDQLLVNHSTAGRPAFTEVSGQRDPYTPRSEVIGLDSFKGMGVTFTYADHGLPSIVVGNITQEWGLQESNLFFKPKGTGQDLLDGRVPYQNESEDLGISRGGWSWDVKAGDFDNSGTDEIMQATGFLRGSRNMWPQMQEVAMGNDELVKYAGAWPTMGPNDDLSGHQPNPFFVKNNETRYTDLAADIGIGETWNTRGLAFGDVNGDGKLDAVLANQFQDSVLLLNQSSAAGRGADVKLVRSGVAGGAIDAVGAQIEVAGGGKAQLYPANGHSGVDSDSIHLALPGMGGPVPATVTWRDGEKQHSKTIQLQPGHQTVMLGDDGTVTTP